MRKTRCRMLPEMELEVKSRNLNRWNLEHLGVLSLPYLEWRTSAYFRMVKLMLLFLRIWSSWKKWQRGMDDQLTLQPRRTKINSHRNLKINLICRVKNRKNKKMAQFQHWALLWKLEKLISRKMNWAMKFWGKDSYVLWTLLEIWMKMYLKSLLVWLMWLWCMFQEQICLNCLFCWPCKCQLVRLS